MKQFIIKNFKRAVLTGATLTLTTLCTMAGNEQVNGFMKKVKQSSNQLIQSSSTFNTWYTYQSAQNGAWTLNQSSPATHKGKRIAVVMSGLMGNPNQMLKIASFLSQAESSLNGNMTKRYDEVWCYHWDPLTKFSDLAIGLEKKLNPYIESACKFEYFCHSASGIFTREAVCKTLGKNGCRVALIGTPNYGLPNFGKIPKEKLGNLEGLAIRVMPFMNQLIPCLAELQNDSDYWKMPNLINFKDRVHYYTIAGTRPTNFNLLIIQGNQIESLHRTLEPNVETDGLISKISVHHQSLGEESTSWHNNESQRKDIPCHHMQLLEWQNTTNILRDWIKDWPLN